MNYPIDTNELDILLERYDQTDTATQRQLVGRLLADRLCLLNAYRDAREVLAEVEEMFSHSLNVRERAKAKKAGKAVRFANNLIREIESQRIKTS